VENSLLKWPRPLVEGSLASIPLPDLLQVLQSETGNIVLVMHGTAPVGTIWIQDGLVLKCRNEGAEGREAFVEIVRNRARGFRIYKLDPRKRSSVVRPVGEIQALLLEAAAYVDEATAEIAG